MKKMIRASVVICTYNPHPGYLQRVLDSLHSQTVSPENWELLIVDNASDETLAFDCSWHPGFRIVREDQRGIAFARMRGMREAFGDLIIFVDDDTVLAPNYLETALRIEREWPMLGVWGTGHIRPEFEIEPPEEIRPYLGHLGIREVPGPVWSNVVSSLNPMIMPWGAGQCLRSKVAANYCHQFESSKITINSHRRSEHSMASGEDVEIGYAGCIQGLGVGLFPELQLTHIISRYRLTEDYIVNLVGGTAFNDLLLVYKWQGIVPASPITGILGVPRFLKNVLTRKGIKRRIYLAEIKSQFRARSVIRELANGKIEAGA